MTGGGTIDYPSFKLLLNRIVNLLIRVLFRIPLNDTTNAFKAYRETVIDGCRPLIAAPRRKPGDPHAEQPHRTLVVPMRFQ